MDTVTSYIYGTVKGEVSHCQESGYTKLYEKTRALNLNTAELYCVGVRFNLLIICVRAPCTWSWNFVKFYVIVYIYMGQ